ncbi:Hypothetical protein D9617_1g083120 [Elsinoe fawcettii]|nr:Hypothetical protein D9617_1g083120 [Elsinoe fawcettii]
MHLTILTLCCLLTPTLAVPATLYPLSIRMALSTISRSQGILTNVSERSSWLQAGFTSKTFRRILDLYPTHPSAPAIRSHLVSSVDSVLPTILNATADLGISLDRLSNGNQMLALYQETGDPKYRAGYETLRLSIDLQPRTAEGGMWYYVYPGWGYLDGMYSLLPFYARYNTEADKWNVTAREDVRRQLRIVREHCTRKDGLLVHGYDANRNASWADPVTGASPYVWGRSLGWYVMALVDLIELFAERAGDVREELAGRLQEVMEAVVREVDGESGVWWQIVDLGGREGNYLESSASAMFVYALLKGVRLGYLADGGQGSAVSNWTAVATKGYQYIFDNFVKEGGNGTLEYDKTVTICSLNSTASYEYYVHQPIVYNSVLGTNAFILASLEYEQLQH